MQSDRIERIRRAALGRLEDLQRAGVAQLPRSAAQGALSDKPQKPTSNKTEPMPATPRQTVSSTTSAKTNKLPGGASLPFGDEGGAAAYDAPSAATLEILQQQVAGCTRCAELAGTRTQTVFGVGNPAARLCFVGEAPGGDEDRVGEPFVGRAGQKLNDILKACRLTREEVYILNMVKCRPPGNRNPLPQELENCRGYLERQLNLIGPEFICCLGAVAAQNLLATTVPIGKLRGKFHNYRGIKVVCTYHPAFLLRSPSFKKQTWEDMKMLMREMGVEL